jgi:hypothetical protein
MTCAPSASGVIIPAMGTEADAPRWLRFRAEIEIEGVNPFVRVGAARAARLRPGWRKPMPVLVRIDGAPAEPWRINMMPKRGGLFFLYLHGIVRKATGTQVGDRVRVEIALDEGYRAGPARMPPYFAAALKAHPRAAAGYGALPSSRRKELVKLFARLKSPEARARNLAMALRVLSGEPGRFMARAWKDGR